MLELIYHLRLKENFITNKEDFFNLGDEYIPSIRISTGKISENLNQLKLFTNEMNAMYDKFGINTCKRKIHFIAQMYAETNRFRSTSEYLKPTAKVDIKVE